VRTADLGALVPIDSQPSQTVEDARHHLRLRALDVGVLDAEDEGAAVTARDSQLKSAVRAPPTWR
jgi:hypothetical protein